MRFFIKMVGINMLTYEENRIKRRRSERITRLQQCIDALDHNLFYYDLVKGTKYENSGMLGLIRELNNYTRELKLMGVDVEEYRHQIAQKVKGYRKRQK